MVLEMKIPSPGESITEVEISQWMVKDGDIVSKDQTIAEIDSDKATLDLPAEASGKITFKAEEGDTMSVGDIVCLIDTSQASVTLESSNDNIKDNVQEENKIEIDQSDDISITPLARNIASDKGIDINDIQAKGEKITKEDVNKAYIKIQKKIHPDVSPETTRLSAIVNEAKEIVLKNIN